MESHHSARRGVYRAKITVREQVGDELSGLCLRGVLSGGKVVVCGGARRGERAAGVRRLLGEIEGKGRRLGF